VSGPAPRLVAVAAGKVFEAARIPYVLAGSMASMAHGEIRGTLDVDFATLMRKNHIEGFIRAATDGFRFDSEWIALAVAQQRMFQMMHATSVIKVDVYVRPDEGLYASEIRRGQRMHLGTGAQDFVVVASPEDTILQKLRWYREGGGVSDRQWRDICGVLKAKSGELDGVYMATWARELDLEELLEKARVNSGGSDS